MRISTILDKIDNKSIFIPAFQREFVWKREDAKRLINSLINNYPTGTILTWETMDPPELKRAEYRPEMGAVKLILDGQQRLTTLYMLIRDSLPPYYVKDDIGEDIRGLYYNVQTRELEYYTPAKMAKDPFWVNLKEIFNNDLRSRRIIEEYESISEHRLEREEFDKLQDIIDDNIIDVRKIVDKDFPELEVPATADVVEAIDIFDIVNSSGTKLTEAELALAQITGKWPQAREKFKKKLLKMRVNNFDLNLDFIVYLLQAILYHSGSEMKRLHKNSAEEIKSVWEILEKDVLDYAINLLKQRAFIDSTEEISSSFNLIPFITFIYDQPDHTLSEGQINQSLNWLLLSLLWQRYIYQAPQTLDKDLRIINENKSNPFPTLIDQISDDRGRIEVKPDDLTGRPIQHPIYKLMILAAKANNAVCFGTGATLRINVGEKYKLECDHIFPFSILKERGYTRDNHLKYKLAQELTNRVLMTQKANRDKSNVNPFDYLNKVESKYPNSLEKQFIPLSKELWKIEAYEKFLESRRMIVAEAINDFIASFVRTKEENLEEINVSQIISNGENGKAEFKSSFRWDLRSQTINKELEKVVLKTIAGFMNSEGGVLLVGVADNGDILGINDDILSLGRQDKDGFENHFNQVFIEKLGVENRHYVKVVFQEVNEKLICVIKVQKASQPIFMKNEAGQEDFYVRTGNGTNPLSFSEAEVYKDEHWKR